MSRAEPRASEAAQAHDLWVFGYGSLMWRTGFAVVETQRARLVGYRRCFCVISMHHRGSPGRPGLVLGLDRGGDCEGMAFRVAAKDAAAVRAYLRERELIYGVYRECLLPVLLHAPHTRVDALAYVVEPRHPCYAGRLPVAEQARRIRGAEGISGANIDYLVNTVRHLRELRIEARELDRVLALAGPLAACGVRDDGVSHRSRGLARAARAHPVQGRALKLEERRRFLYRARVLAA